MTRQPDLPVAERITSHQIVRLLEERHQPPEWAGWAELADGTASNKRRTIDYFAMSLWPSNDYRGIAYEVKVSRADFRRELDDPSKRHPWELRAHECWFVAPVGVIPVSEVPEVWGLLELEGSQLVRKKRAAQRSPDPWPHAFVAAIARRTGDKPPTEPLAAWELAGRRLELADLARYAAALVRHRPSFRELVRKHDAPPPLYGDPLVRAKLQDDDRRRIGQLAGQVARLCGRQVNTAEQFATWFETHARGAVTEDVRHRLIRLHTATSELLEGFGVDPHKHGVWLPRS